MKTLTKLCLLAGTLLATASMPAAAADDAIARIKSSGVLRACVVDYAPLTFKDPQGTEWEGMYVDMAKRFAELLGTRFEPVESAWKTFVQNLQTGKCDISVAPTYATAARSVEVLFSNPISEDGQAAWALDSSGFATLADLDQAGKVIAVKSGSANERLARQMFKNAEIKPIVSDVAVTSLMEVATKRVDGAFIATMLVENMKAKNPNLKNVTMVGEAMFPSGIAWSVPLGEYHLQQTLNAFFQELEQDGEMEKLKAQYLTTQ